ncbi:hypothetical protein ALC62_08224 [Cyphomyrmex costatus]|uniref:Uncharacterized protein n=1 Tax=Cyphomyrmex costatus TaxID=456900 RepID=A0A195CJV8_9HYME|nr:hypothetical protein ALC62_08224 [Cyphomyrmex costatus]
MDTVGVNRSLFQKSPEMPLAIGRNGFHRSPVDTSLACFDFGGLQTKFFGSSGIVVAPTVRLLSCLASMSSCSRDNVGGSCKEHSLSPVNKILQSAASVSDLIEIRVRRSVAERDFTVYIEVLASLDISDVNLSNDLGFQINSYDSLCGPCFETFYAKIQGLMLAVGRCCPLESGIDSAPLSMSDLSFENSGAYKATVSRNQPAPETVKTLVFPSPFRVFAYLNTLYKVRFFII